MLIRPWSALILLTMIRKNRNRGGRGNVKAKKKTEPCAIKIGRVSRGKKKSVTHITGLGSYEVRKISHDLFSFTIIILIRLI